MFWKSKKVESPPEEIKPEPVQLRGDDDCFARARKILKCCNIHGAECLVGTIAEVLTHYATLDKEMQEQVRDSHDNLG